MVSISSLVTRVLRMEERQNEFSRTIWLEDGTSLVVDVRDLWRLMFLVKKAELDFKEDGLVTEISDADLDLIKKLSAAKNDPRLAIFTNVFKDFIGGSIHIFIREACSRASS